MTQFFLTIAAIFGGLSVAGGAFGAHALREKISERSLEIFDTGARYQMYHALALLLVAMLISRLENPPTTLLVSGWLFIIGVVIFSLNLKTSLLTWKELPSIGQHIGVVHFFCSRHNCLQF